MIKIIVAILLSFKKILCNITKQFLHLIFSSKEYFRWVLLHIIITKLNFINYCTQFYLFIYFLLFWFNLWQYRVNIVQYVKTMQYKWLSHAVMLCNIKIMCRDSLSNGLRKCAMTIERWSDNLRFIINSCLLLKPLLCVLNWCRSYYCDYPNL